MQAEFDSFPLATKTTPETLALAYRPFDAIAPLDPNSLARIPLSTTPTAATFDDAALTEVQRAEAAFPLILVTGKSPALRRTEMPTPRTRVGRGVCERATAGRVVLMGRAEH